MVRTSNTRKSTEQMFSRQHSTNQDHLLNLQHKAEHYSAATLSSVDFYTNSVRFRENGVY